LSDSSGEEVGDEINGDGVRVAVVGRKVKTSMHDKCRRCRRCRGRRRRESGANTGRCRRTGAENVMRHGREAGDGWFRVGERFGGDAASCLRLGGSRRCNRCSGSSGWRGGGRWMRRRSSRGSSSRRRRLRGEMRAEVIGEL